jgi:hypothetical protein
VVGGVQFPVLLAGGGFGFSRGYTTLSRFMSFSIRFRIPLTGSHDFSPVLTTYENMGQKQSLL